MNSNSLNKQKKSFSTLLLILFLAIQSTLFFAFINPYKGNLQEVAQTECTLLSGPKDHIPEYDHFYSIVNSTSFPANYFAVNYTHFLRCASLEVAIAFSCQSKKHLAILRPNFFTIYNNFITSEDEDSNLKLS